MAPFQGPAAAVAARLRHRWQQCARHREHNIRQRPSSIAAKSPFQPRGACCRIWSSASPKWAAT